MTSGILPANLGSLEARNSEGTGNNLTNTNWGAAGTYIRVTPNSYADGAGVMEAGPAPRAISDAVLAQPQVGGVDVDLPNAAETNEFFQFFGQFVTHDVTEASGGGTEIVNLAGLPFPFIRTPFSTVNGVREQFTIETSFLDLSMVYGANANMLAMLRDDIVIGGVTVQSAKLLTSAANVLPSFQDVADDGGITPLAVLQVNGGVTATGQFSPQLLVSGDDRTNQSASLITHHTLWVREHNYQVDQLSAQFPTWTQDQLFNAARAITEAEWQHVVYAEYLPKLVGENALAAYAGYKATINPAVINEWATVAFRFGHDQSSNSFDTLGENGATTGSFTLGDAFNLANASNAIRNSGSLDEWIRGQLSHQTQEIDGKIVDGNRNLLFGGAVTDLNVLDIQRGRDHGVGDYNTLRAGLGLATYASFQAFALDNNLAGATLQALIDVYGTIASLDSIVGGLLEKHVAGSQLGATFTRLTVMQFENLRDGDRFYFENRLAGEPALVADIKATSLADIILRNTDIQYLYHDAFAAHERIGGSGGSETLIGSAKKDLITGYAGNDTANGGDGDDDIYGGDGDDYLLGQGGTDRLAGEGGNDTLEGGAGADRLDGGGGGDTASYAGSAAVIVNLETGTGAGGNASGDTLISIENIVGGTGADALTGNGSANALSGGGGNDTLQGGAGNDTLAGDDGDDYLDGGTGADRLFGGAGDDTYLVDDPFDFIQDSSGYDTVFATINYTLAEGSGVERLISIGSAPVQLSGNGSANVFLGGSGNDVFDGRGGNDSFSGGGGNDKLLGGAGADYLAGEAGNDWLYGGADNDVLVGGAGRDMFVFNTKPNKKSNFDRVRDFNVKDDSLALDNAIFKKIGKGSETKPLALNKNFFTTGDHAQDANDYVFYNKKSGILYYDADGSGRGKAVEIATLSKNLKMTYHDIFVI